MRALLAKIHWANVGALAVIIAGLLTFWVYAFGLLFAALGGA